MKRFKVAMLAGDGIGPEITTEAEKDCRLIGWSALMEVNSNV